MDEVVVGIVVVVVVVVTKGIVGIVAGIYSWALARRGDGQVWIVEAEEIVCTSGDFGFGVGDWA